MNLVWLSSHESADRVKLSNKCGREYSLKGMIASGQNRGGDHTLGDYYLTSIRACERKKIEEKTNICAFDFTCKAIVKCERVEMPGSYL